MAIEPRRVNRESRGLLDLFRAKVGGKQPDTFEQKIRCIVNNTPFLSVAGMEVQVDNVTSANGNTSFTVPQDEAWLIHYASCTCLATPSAAFQVVVTLSLLQIQKGSGTSSEVVLDRDMQRWTALATEPIQATAVYNPGKELLLPPDCMVRGAIRATASNTATLAVWYTPLKV